MTLPEVVVWNPSRYGKNLYWIDGNALDGDGPEVEPAPDDETVAYYVLVTDDDGAVVERIPIREGQDVSIVGPSDERVAEANETAG